MQPKQTALRELKKVLEEGYKLQEERNLFQVQRVPRNGEPGFSNDSFRQYLRFGANGSTIYNDYTQSIKDIFTNFGLSFARFRSKTESINPTTDADSPAGLLIRQLHELDKIVNDEPYFESYILPVTRAEVTFTDGVVGQGYKQHTFKQDKHRDLLYLLWDGRRISTPKGKILRAEKPIPREQVYEKLHVEHERFKDIVRAIKIEMKRKDIKLDIKFPKDVFVVVTQDSM